MNAPCSIITDSAAAIRYLAEAGKKQFGAITVTRPISVGNFSATFESTVSRRLSNSTSICLGKVCAGPLSIEGKIYELAGNHPLFPRCYGVHWLAEDLAVIFLELLRGPLLKDNPSPEALQAVISLIAKFHRHMTDNLVSVLPHMGHLTSLPGDWVMKTKELASRTENIAGPLGREASVILTDVAAHCAGVLGYHGPTLVHGDLYGDNVIMTGDGPRIIDWGFAHVGIGIVDAVTLLEHIPRKNGASMLSLEQQKGILRNGMIDAGITDYSQVNANAELHCAKVLIRMEFLGWLCNRVELNAWAFGDPAKAILEQWSDLLKTCREALQ